MSGLQIALLLVQLWIIVAYVCVMRHYDRKQRELNEEMRQLINRHLPDKFT